MLASADRESFDPATAASYDVVLLDWPQRITDPTNWASRLVSPLGARDKWPLPARALKKVPTHRVQVQTRLDPSRAVRMIWSRLSQIGD